jgi:NAD(P)-dependent dehydrogenase (short-subunit alcohol dehydrogenase family)
MEPAMNRFDNKVVIITGGAGGPASLGAEIVRRFHAENAKVVIADINQQQGAQLADQLGDNVRFVRTDIRQDQDLEKLVSTTVQQFGQLDCLINCAATYAESGLDSDREEWLNLLNINTVSPALLVKAALPELKKTSGCVINFASVAGKISQTGLYAYSISKAANLQLTRKLAAELAVDGIRVNTVSPGWTWSDPIAGATGNSIEKADQAAARLHPLGRIGRGKDVAEAILFLCSEQASFITGIDLPVDGGYTTLGPEQMKSPFDWLAE